MKAEQVDEYLRRQGWTEEDLAAERAHLDQGAAAVDDLIVEAVAATHATSPDEAMLHGLAVIALVRAHGDISPEAMDFVQQVAARLGHAVIHIWDLHKQIDALKAENARLRRGR